MLGPNGPAALQPSSPLVCRGSWYLNVVVLPAYKPNTGPTGLGGGCGAQSRDGDRIQGATC
eukprot:713590-Amphidinium_carterae.2